jgi:hypothetical protein
MATFASFSTRLASRVRALDSAWRWAIGVYVGARIFYTLWSVAVMLLVPTVLQNLDLFGVPVVAYFDVASSERYVYARTVGGQVLTFRAGAAGTLRDVETDSVWSLRDGEAIEGALAGTKLAVAVYTAEDVFPYRGVMPERGWFGVWQRFDAQWYQAIAERGYDAVPGAIHFPPLFPLLENLVARIFGGRTFFAGWLISQLALVASLALLYRTAVRWQNTFAVKRALIFLVLFPTAFFLFTAYSEALFLLWSLLCFDALRHEKWSWAGFWAFLGILTRLQGVALFAPLLYWVWQTARKNSPPRFDWRSISFAQIFMLALPLVAGAFYLLLRALAGESAIVPTTEAALNARLVFPWDNILYAFQTLASGKFLLADVLNLLAFALAIFLLWRGWRFLPVEFSIYVAVTLIVASVRWVDTQPLNSMTRYVLTLFPLFMLLAYWSKNRWIERAVVYTSVPLGLYLSAQFLTWGWVA